VKPAIFGTWADAIYSLGNTDRAAELTNVALSICREADNRFGEGFCMGALAEFALDQSSFEEARQLAREAVDIGEETQNSSVRSSYSCTLSLASMECGDFAEGRAIAEAAIRFEEVNVTHRAYVLLGIAARRQGDEIESSKAFAKAASEAGALLSLNPRHSSAHDSWGIALCGLLLLGQPDLLAEAQKTFRAGRKIQSDAGAVRHVERLLRLLVGPNVPEWFETVRTAARGLVETAADAV
jgi:hypothetical protein